MPSNVDLPKPKWPFATPREWHIGEVLIESIIEHRSGVFRFSGLTPRITMNHYHPNDRFFRGVVDGEHPLAKFLIHLLSKHALRTEILLRSSFRLKCLIGEQVGFDRKLCKRTQTNKKFEVVTLGSQAQIDIWRGESSEWPTLRTDRSGNTRRRLQGKWISFPDDNCDVIFRNVLRRSVVA